jgi:hypothetical protein
MKSDRDSILELKFFEELYPMIHPDVSDEIKRHAREKDMIEHRLYGSGKLLEAAISKRKGLERHDTKGMDFIDGSDAKASSVRWTSNGTTYAAPIKDIANKRGLLRCMVYERLQDKFYYFLIPYSAYRHIPVTSNIEIGFNLDGSPKKAPTQNTIVNWWDFNVPDFEGILQDIEIDFINYKVQRQEKKFKEEQARQERLRLREQAKQLRQSKVSLLIQRSADSKTDSTLGTSNPYNLMLDLFRTQDQLEQLPIVPSD